MYIFRNLHRAVIDVYETLVGLMNSAEAQHMKQNYYDSCSHYADNLTNNC